MNKRIKKKKAKQKARYLAALERILMPLWSYYKPPFDSPLMNMINAKNAELNYQIPYELK